MSDLRVARATALAVVLASAIMLCTILSLGFGSVQISPHDVIEVILRRASLISGDSVSVITDRIVWELRMPRILGTLSVGASLAICGVVLQSLTRNKLADPYLLGISSGASVGAVSVIVFNLSLPFVPLNLSVTTAAFVGALIALIVVLTLATGRSGTLPPSRTILTGVAVGQLCGAFTATAITFFGKRETANTVMSWTLGSFAGVRWTDAVILLAATAVSLIILLLAARTLDAFAFGETSARSLGVNVERARWLLLVTTALITAITVAFVGPIGFVGLTVPHLVRMVIGPAHQTLLPISALAGAVILLIADTLARTIRPGSEAPIGILTALIGAPLLVFLLRRQAANS